jgi:CHASE2 domain-containing sensor protein
MRKFFQWYYFFGLLAILGVLLAVQQLALRIDFLNPFEQALSDFNATDVAFGMRPPQTADTSIVLVNIGNLPRIDIAQQIAVLNHFGPRVIGVDVEFRHEIDSLTDSTLEAAFAQANNLVLFSKLEQGRKLADSTEVWDSLRRNLPRFAKHGASGFTNALTEGDSPFETWRETSAQEKMANGWVERSFATQVAWLYDSARTKKILARRRDSEIINFRGNSDKFVKLDADDVLDTLFTPETIRDKIVIICYLGGIYTDVTWDADRFYTPLNPKQIGRTAPDMFGGVIHANIVSMILHENFIDEVPEWICIIIALLLGYCNVVLFARIEESKRYGLWYDLITKLIQLAETVLVTYLVIFLFAGYNLKVDLTYSIFVIVLSGDVFEIYATLWQNLKAKLNKSK